MRQSILGIIIAGIGFCIATHFGGRESLPYVLLGMMMTLITTQIDGYYYRKTPDDKDAEL